LAQAQKAGVTLQVAADRVKLAGADFHDGSASFLDRGRTIFLGHGQDAENATDGGFAIIGVHRLAERADLSAGLAGPDQQLQRAGRRLFGAILWLNAATTTRLTQMFPQQLPSPRVEQTDTLCIPLNGDSPADPARWHSVISCFDFHTAIQMNGAFSVLVITEGFQR